MKSIYCILLGLFVFFVSCNKNDDDNITIDPPAPQPKPWEWFRVMRIDRTTLLPNSYKIYHRDSIEIELYAALNKIEFRKYQSHFNGVNFDRDTSVETFTYNSEHQLVLYEHHDSYDELFISRMEFVRDAHGLLTKVLSQYNNGSMAGSEGIVAYHSNRDTAFITFIDSTRKHRSGYTDAQDYYQVGLIRNKVVYRKDYSMAMPGKLDSTQSTIEYANGNKVKETSQYNNNTPVTTTWRWSEFPNFSETKQLQKFLTQWAGDLHWFTRSKLFNFSELINVSPATGKGVYQVKKNGVYKLEFLEFQIFSPYQGMPGYDDFGWSKAIETSGSPAYHKYFESYYYRP